MEQLTYTINKIDYLLFTCPFPLSNKFTLDSFYEKVKVYNGILQGAKKVEGGFWGTSYFEVKVLIPQSKALDFSNEME